MAGKILLEVVTPEHLLLSKQVDEVIAPGTDWRSAISSEDPRKRAANLSGGWRATRLPERPIQANRSDIVQL